MMQVRSMLSGNWFESLVQSLRQSGQIDERRRAIRVGLRFNAQLAIINPEGPLQPFQICVKDVSSQGLGFTCDRTLEPGQKVAIWIPQHNAEYIRILAEVRNCRLVEGSDIFSVGVLFLHMGQAPQPAIKPPKAAKSAAPSAPAPAPPMPIQTEEQIAAIRQAIFG